MESPDFIPFLESIILFRIHNFFDLIFNSFFHSMRIQVLPSPKSVNEVVNNFLALDGFVECNFRTLVVTDADIQKTKNILHRLCFEYFHFEIPIIQKRPRILYFVLSEGQTVFCCVIWTNCLFCSRFPSLQIF